MYRTRSAGSDRRPGLRPGIGGTDLHDLGVRSVAIPRVSKPGAARLSLNPWMGEWLIGV